MCNVDNERNYIHAHVRQECALEQRMDDEREETQEKDKFVICHRSYCSVAAIAFITETVDGLVRLHIPWTVGETLREAKRNVSSDRQREQRTYHVVIRRRPAAVLPDRGHFGPHGFDLIDASAHVVHLAVG